MKICVNVPSIHPDRCLRMLDSFNENMGRNKKHFYFHIVAQGWTEDQLDSLDPLLAISVGPLEAEPSMIELRMITADRFACLPEYYMFIDDDIVYEKGADQFFDDVIHSLDNVKPAVYQLFKNRYPPHEVYHPENCIMTINRGLIVRSNAIRGLMGNYPSLLGGGEDALIGYWALATDNSRIIRGGAPISTDGVKHFSNTSESFIHNSDIFDQNCGKAIRQMFDDEDWELLSGHLPKGIQSDRSNIRH